MLKILGIDSEKCIKCESCVQICLVNLFSVEKLQDMRKKIVFDDTYKFCFRCGHCISICPTKAIDYEGAEEPYEFEEIKKPEELLSYDDLIKVIRTRRTHRAFKEKPVEKEKIEKVLEAMRYAPTASNRQRQQFIVLTNKDEIAELSEKVMVLFFKIRKLLKFKHIIAPFVPKGLRRRLKSKKTELQLQMYYDRTLAGEDLVFYHAPCVIILHAPAYSQMSASDGGIALTHGMLAAQSLGLGTAWIGFAQEYLWRNKKYRRKLGIPERNNCYGVLILGYPKYKFERAPPRNPLKVKWRE
ncbi:MAG: nitroreductase family protein [Candidatus Heimdallarchaeaceae archaeon]